ncbi:MAG TPA: hypothetical protein VH640_29450, partial [Bryobacteraceae bacterium]
MAAQLSLDSCCGKVLACALVEVALPHDKNSVLLETAARQNRILDGLSDDSLNRLLQQASLIDLERDRVLYRSDRTMPAIYFPASGTVALLVGAQNG